MPASKYYRTIVAAYLGLAVCIVMLSIALYSNGPRGRLLRTSSDLTSSQLTKGSTMTVVFDRPIEQKDYTDIVSLSPGLDISTRTTTQSIVITLNEHLRHDTEYVLAIEPELYDAAGIKMKQAYRHTFTTSPASYTYVQRQYETNKDAGRDQANDSLYLADTEGVSEPIFEHPEIRMYDANSAHAVVVAQGPEYDELYTIDLATKSVRREALPLNGRIYSVAMSDSGSQALYSIWPEGNNLEAAQANALPNRVESLNVESGEIVPLADRDGQPIRGFDVQLDATGQVALLQDVNQTYYAISPFNDFSPIVIGTHEQSFGFNDDNSELLFKNRDDLVRYEIASGEVIDIEIESDWFIREASTTSGTIYVASSGSYLSQPHSVIDRYMGWSTSQAEMVWNSYDLEDISLRTFSESYDGSLLAIQVENAGCIYDNIGRNSQCQDAKTIMYDVDNQEALREISGFGVIWLP